MRDVYIAGVGMTNFGNLTNKNLKQISEDAINSALIDSKLSKQNIQSVYFANATQGAIEGQFMIPGQVCLRSIGIEQIPVVNIENACASASSAFSLAVKDIRSGDNDVVLAIGADKMITEDKHKMMSVFEGALDVSEKEKTFEKLISLGIGLELPDEAKIDTGIRSIFMDIYASFAKQHMRNFGTTQRQLAIVASKNHMHSVHNEKSQFRKKFTVDEVLEARLVSWPFTIPMCSPISDGGACALLCSEEAIKKYSLSKSRMIKVSASEMGTGSSRDPDDQSKHLTSLIAKKAYDKSSLDPKDISLAEVHDASAIAEIMQTENLGFCKFGEGGYFAEKGNTKIGGKIPVNTSGGLESKGHPIGATGLGQIYELVLQLRGEAGKRQIENPRFGIAENGGGTIGVEEATACITILEKI